MNDQPSLSPIEVVRSVTDAWNAGDLDRIPQLVAADALDHSRSDRPAADADEWDRVRRAIRADIPDIRVHVERVVAAGDTVARLLTTRGTRAGRAFEVSGIDIVRVRDGQIVEHWAVSEPFA